MDIVLRIIFGGIGVAVGFILTTKADWFCNNFGRIGWFEKHGGTRFGYRLIGMLFIFLSFTYITGMWGVFIDFMLSPLTKHT